MKKFIPATQGVTPVSTGLILFLCYLGIGLWTGGFTAAALLSNGGETLLAIAGYSVVAVILWPAVWVSTLSKLRTTR